jgi:hypothetical protein
MQYLGVLLGVFCFAGLVFAQEQKEQGVGGSDFHKNDITYSTEIETPHVKWATTLPGGPVKGFFIPTVRNGRDMVELMQRMSLAPTTVTIDPSWDSNCWGIGDYYGAAYRGDRDDFVTVHGYAEKDLSGPAKFEVMVIPSMNGWSRLTTPTRDAILRRVSEGAGLVLIRPTLGDVVRRPMRGDPAEPDLRLWDLSPLQAEGAEEPQQRGRRGGGGGGPTGVWTILKPHFITEGLALELLPEGTVGNGYSNYKATGDVIIAVGDKPIMAVKEFGKGRVVAFAYSEAGFAPRPIDPTSAGIYWNYWEYQYSLLSKAILWAAGREAGVDIVKLTAAPGDAGARIELTAASDAPRKVTVEVTGHGEFGTNLGLAKTTATLTKGENSIVVDGDALKPVAGFPGGMAIYDVIVKDAATGATLNWGAATFMTAKAAAIDKVTPGADLYQRGDTVSATVASTGNLDGLKVRMTVSDDLDRVLSVETSPAAAENAFTYKLEDHLGKYAFLTAELVSPAGAIVDQKRVQPVLVVQRPEERRAKEYTAMISFGGGKHFQTSERSQLIRAGGAQTGFTWGGSVNNGLSIPRGSFGVYWYDRGPTDEAGIEAAIKKYEESGDIEGLQYLTRKELYKRTGDKKFLMRVPCFDDPAFMQKLYDGINTTAENKARYNLDYYFVGDEGSLTSYSDNVDFCFSPHTLAAEREWLKTEYPSLDGLNASWKTSFATWDEVTPYTTAEAKKAGNYAAWGDHRTYMEITFAKAYATVRKAVTDGDPAGHIALSGTQQPMSYNGCDWYRLDKVIDDFLAYTGGGQLDLHRSFAKPGSMIGFWTGYGSSGIAVQNAIWTNAVHGFLYPNIFWMPSYLDPDMTYSNSARDMGEAFRALRFEGVGKLFMESERLQDGIALHYSMPSMHAASITENFHEKGVTPKRNFAADRDGWIATVKDLGMLFDVVAYEQVEKGALASGKYKAFIMPMSMALSPEEVAAIEAFAESGGIVIADAAAGVMDDHCAWIEEGALNDFFGIKTDPSSKRDYGRSTTISINWEGDEVTSATAAVEQPVTVTDSGKAWGLVADDYKGVEVVEPRLAASAGKALVTVGGSDAVIVKEVGKGWAIYLNVLFDKYSDQRKESFGGAGYRNLTRAVLARAGVKPVVGVFDVNGNPLPQVLVVRYRFADNDVLAIVKENVGPKGVAGRDGVTYFKDANLGEVAKEAVTIKLPKKCYVNDVRTGRQMGLTDTVNTEILVGGTVVLGLAAEENTITLTGPDKARLGEHARFEVTSTKGEKSLVRCHFFGPDGRFLSDYAKNVLVEKGSGSVVLPSALNDARGTYTLKATDVVTGASAERKITLE